MAKTYFDDPSFQAALIALLCRDVTALKLLAPLLTDKDFRPLNDSDTKGKGRWIIAQIALDYWQRYEEAIGDLLRPTLLSYASDNRLSEQRQRELLSVGRALYQRKLSGADSIIEHVVHYKKERLRAEAIREIIDLQAAGQMDDDKWREICERALQIEGTLGDYQITDYFDELELRIDRRAHNQSRRYPLLYIEPLDVLVRAISFGHLGLVMGPYKSGKSLMLIWLALAYCLQKHNVMHVTLEDPRDDVEDRFDAATTAIPIKALREDPDEVRRKFLMYRRYVRSKLRIVDGTEHGMRVRDIEAVIQRERQKGFITDVLIIDYDDEIVPPRKQRERRFEFADIYRELRQLAATHNMIIWTAAQTQRGTEEKKVVKASTVAEDISKPRKVTMAVSIGQGIWGASSKHLHVAAHKFDRMGIGCDVMVDFERMVFYDHAATMRQLRADRQKAKREGGDTAA